MRAMALARSSSFTGRDAQPLWRSAARVAGRAARSTMAISQTTSWRASAPLVAPQRMVGRDLHEHEEEPFGVAQARLSQLPRLEDGGLHHRGLGRQVGEGGVE